jgi:ribose 5-phosphate isomerase B
VPDDRRAEDDVTTPDVIRSKVRQAVYRALGMEPHREPVPGRRLVTEHDLRDLAFGPEFALPPGALITPLARQAAMDRRLTLRPQPEAAPAPTPASARAASPAPGTKAVALGADHGGFKLKESLKAYLRELGHEVIDCGTTSTEAVDYPDFALAVGELVGQGRAALGILVDGAGIDSCMAANKVPGVRAALCCDQSSAVNSREHNDANVLTLGAGLIGEALARQIVRTFVETPFGGGRHARRADKIMETERRFLRRAEPSYPIPTGDTEQDEA